MDHANLFYRTQKKSRCLLELNLGPPAGNNLLREHPPFELAGPGSGRITKKYDENICSCKIEKREKNNKKY